MLNIYQAYAETAKNLDYTDILWHLFILFYLEIDKDLLAYVYSIVCKNQNIKLIIK